MTLCYKLSSAVACAALPHPCDTLSLVDGAAGWMNVLAPFAGAAFEWNHDRIMRAGGEGLAKLLDARLLGAS